MFPLSHQLVYIREGGWAKWIDAQRYGWESLLTMQGPLRGMRLHLCAQCLTEYLYERRKAMNN